MLRLGGDGLLIRRSWVRAPCHLPVALTIARIPALIACGSLCHAAITVARPGSVLRILAKQEPKTGSALPQVSASAGLAAVGHRTLIPETGVRIPLGVPSSKFGPSARMSKGFLFSVQRLTSAWWFKCVGGLGPPSARPRTLWRYKRNAPFGALGQGCYPWRGNYSL